MAGFEVIVRPVVFPNIRPAPAQVLPPEDDPTQGMCVIKGGGATKVGASRNWSVSLSRQKPHTEVIRQVNKERVYQKDKNGEINKKNYIDLERLKKVRIDTDDGPVKYIYSNPPKPDNVEILEKNKTIPYVDEDRSDFVG